MTSTSDNPQGQLRKNPKAKARTCGRSRQGKGGGGIAFRFGGALSWSCLKVDLVAYLALWVGGLGLNGNAPSHA